MTSSAVWTSCAVSASATPAIVASVKDAKARVEASKRTLETRQDEQVARRSQARDKAEQVQRALEEQERYAASLKADLKQLIEQERKRQAAIAAKLKAEAEARAKEIARRNSEGRAFTGQLGDPHPEVVRIAENYLGVPYVWGGVTPSGFDCSGLVQYCYRQVGIDLPRTSRVQFHARRLHPAGSSRPSEARRSRLLRLRRRRESDPPRRHVRRKRNDDPRAIHRCSGLACITHRANQLAWRLRGRLSAVGSAVGEVPRWRPPRAASPPLTCGIMRLPSGSEAGEISPRESIVAVGKRSSRAGCLGSRCRGRRGLSRHPVDGDPPAVPLVPRCLRRVGAQREGGTRGRRRSLTRRCAHRSSP